MYKYLPFGLCLDEEIPQKKEINGNWDLLEEYYNKSYTKNLLISRNKKGFRRLEIWEAGMWGLSDCFCCIVKEEKQKDINIKVIWRYEEAHVSIQKILEYNDSEKAIKYLVERGLTVYPIGGK